MLNFFTNDKVQIHIINHYFAIAYGIYRISLEKKSYNTAFSFNKKPAIKWRVNSVTYFISN